MQVIHVYSCFAFIYGLTQSHVIMHYDCITTACLLNQILRNFSLVFKLFSYFIKVLTNNLI